MAKLTYTTETADYICTEMAQGRSLSAICREEGMPDYSTVFDWLRKYPDFADNYARAREVSGDADADEIKDIKSKVETGEVAPDAARVMIDALKWSAGKRQPKVYGDRVAVDMTVDDKRDDAELLSEARNLAEKLGVDLSALGEPTVH